MYKAIEYLRLLERKCHIAIKKIRLTNTAPTIIASNCVGTLIYSDLKLPFYSPLHPCNWLFYEANPKSDWLILDKLSFKDSILMNDDSFWL